MIDISFLIGELNKEHGGAQQLLYDVCRCLPEDEFDRTVYYLFGKGTFRKDFERVDTRVVSLDANGNYDGKAYVRLLNELRRHSPDVLHTNSPISRLWGHTAARLTGVPHVVSVEHHVHDTRRPLTRAVDDVTLALADSVVGVSETVATSFAPWERFLLERARTHTHTITNGVDVEALDAKRHETDDVLGPYAIEPSDPILGTVGRLTGSKGHRYLIDAMESVVNEYPNVKLLVVGDGSERVTLERQAYERGLLDADSTDTVVFVGQQPSVLPFLTRFDIGVFPSLDESFGLALAETMAASVPVIGTDIPSFRDLLNDGDAGVLIPPRDSDALAEAISTLLGDDARQERLRRRGRERVERCFSVKNTARQYANLYRETVRKR